MGRPKGSKNKNKIPLKERFYSKFIINDETNCWEIKPYKGHRYPHIQIDNKSVKGNRLSYELHFGKIPDGLYCLHKCDNTYCVNPSHLFLGTHKDNMHDMIKKGRAKKDGPKGVRCAKHKLNETQVNEIRKLIKQNLNKVEIANKYNVTFGAIYHIARGSTWKHLKESI